MYGQEPLQGKSINIGSPVSEWNIDQYNDQAYEKKFHSEANIPKNIFAQMIIYIAIVRKEVVLSPIISWKKTI